MKRFALIALAIVLLPVTAIARDRPGEHGHARRPYADPSALIAAEIAFSRLAQTKGQWAAFRATAAPDAEMFVPQRVKAVDWLKGRANPAVPVNWQPYAVWSSCDGSYAVTRGAWQRPGSMGSYVTVWQRQKDGKYKWLVDMSLADETIEAAPDTINGIVAECKGSPPAIAAGAPNPDGTMADSKSDSSDDGTIGWTTIVFGSGRRDFILHLWQGSEMRQVFARSSGQGNPSTSR